MGLSAIETLAASRSYTDLSVEGAGAIKGKNCVVSSSVIEGGHRITVGWYRDSDDAYQEFYFDVMDGEDGPKGDPGPKGENGAGIDSVSVDENNNLTVTYEDGTSKLAGQIHLNGEQGYIPCGTRLGYYGITPPLGFLLCDGTEYLKSDYPQLAELLAATDSAQGTTLFAGSDSDHFKVPDLRGEFIRGAGTNSHSGQGNGANIGEHQDATSFPILRTVKDELIPYTRTNDTEVTVTNADGTILGGKYYATPIKFGQLTNLGDNGETAIMTRPTNTSENMIIAYKDIYLSPRHEYSTEEQVVGKWIDGKPIYEKTLVGSLAASSSNDKFQIYNVPTIELMDAHGYVSFGGQKYIINLTDSDNYIIYLRQESTGELSIIKRKFTACSYYITIQYTKTTD